MWRSGGPGALGGRVRLRDMSEPVVKRLEDGTLVDLPGPEDGEEVSASHPDGLTVLRHSAAHVMAQAVLSLWPEAKYAIGPPIEDPPGFYYDFDVPSPFTPGDLEKIEQKMFEIVSDGQPFVREELALDDARKVFEDQPYKLEIIDGIGEESAEQGVVGDRVSVYRNDGFVDLCRGPHVPSTSYVRAFKLLRSSGAYWRGDEKGPSLQRIYGTCWATEEELQAFLKRMAEAEERDHRRLGRELDLFSLPGELGSGLVLWHPKGAVMRWELVRHAEGLHRDSYDFVSTPHLAKSDLWKSSGHLEKFTEYMYPVMQAEEGDYYIKPMNCPFHVHIFKSQTRSYRDLPHRYFELGTVYRHERAGVVQGLMRARGFTQDDSHIFCTEDQLVDELIGVMDLIDRIYEPFGFEDSEIALSTHPGEAIGSPEMWEKATDALRSALERSGRQFTVAEGEGAFYGPKIDFHFRDAIGRLWQLTTVQCDFALPQRFDLEYVGADNERHRPVMIHRAIYGSMERFFGVLVEHFGGAFPTWLAPVQAVVLPIADAHLDYAHKVQGALDARVEIAGPDETLGNRIRKAQGQKVPYMLIVGDREAEAGTVSVRPRTGDERKGVELDSFATELKTEIADRRL